MANTLAWKSWYTDSTDLPEKFSISIRHLAVRFRRLHCRMEGEPGSRVMILSFLPEL